MDALEIIFERNHFYRRQYLLALVLLILALVTILVLSWALVYINHHPEGNYYFAVDNNGRLLEDIPVNEPNMSINDLYAWTINAIEAVNTYDYINYRVQMQEARKYFNDYGWTNYKSSLDAANNLTAIIQRRIISIARVVAAPKITRTGSLYGAYAWRLQMPLLITYWSPPYDDKNKYSNSLQVNVVVQRQPTLQSYNGLSIVQLIESSATTSNELQEISNTPTG